MKTGIVELRVVYRPGQILVLLVVPRLKLDDDRITCLYIASASFAESSGTGARGHTLSTLQVTFARVIVKVCVRTYSNVGSVAWVSP